jgi:hypothetical protein|tara:strand:+ start:701 stop:973 length:273 start_codon:yes stop_codon:yes gene_type:complete
MIYEKRGKWCWRGKDGNLRKFPTKEAALAALALDAPDLSGVELNDNGYFLEPCCECEDCQCDPCECEESEKYINDVAESLKNAKYNTYRM